MTDAPDKNGATITLTDNPDPALEAVLDTGLADYNAEQTGVRDWRALAVAVQDPETGEPVGGLLGRTTCRTTCGARASAAGHCAWQRRKRCAAAAAPRY